MKRSSVCTGKKAGSWSPFCSIGRTTGSRTSSDPCWKRRLPTWKRQAAAWAACNLGRVVVRLSALLCFSLLLGCPDEEPPPMDSGTPDAGEQEDALPPDIGEPDSGDQDAGPRPMLPDRISDLACASCADGCGSENCLRAQSGETFCLDRCDGNVEACPEGFTCIDISGGADPQFFCVPNTVTCMGGSALGQRCIDDAEACTALADICEGDFHNFGYCTTTCADPSECPVGWECSAGDEAVDVCKPTYVSPAEMCARGNDGVEIPCAVDTDCGELAGSICIRSDLALPGVCAQTCGGCGG